MDIYIVKPNLEISNCENSPSNSTLLSKKSDYISLLQKCNRLCQINGGFEKIPKWCQIKSSCHDKNSKCHNVDELPLQSIVLDPQDYKKLEPKSDYSLSKLNIPNNISLVDGKWLALKYLQLDSDIALLRYKYLKSYAKITKLLKKYFSKPEISESEESEGLKQIDNEMSKFKALENILSMLLSLKVNFQNRFSDFESTTPELKQLENVEKLKR